MNNESIKYVYICSSGYSGSTLLDLLLGSHSQIESLGEINHLPKNIALNTICSCGDLINDCNFWKKVVEEFNTILNTDLYKNPYKLNLGLPLPSKQKDTLHKKISYRIKRKIYRGLCFISLAFNFKQIDKLTRPINEGIENLIKLYDIVIKNNKCTIVVDSSKSYLEAVKLYISRPKNVKIILLCRDGRGVLYSGIKRGKNKRKVVTEWKKHYKRAIMLFNKHIPNNRIKKIYYEDLSQNPEKSLIEICRFLNREYEKSMLEFSKFIHHNANGNDMRFVKKSLIKFDFNWQTNLTDNEKEFFRKIGLKTNKMLGYLKD